MKYAILLLSCLSALAAGSNRYDYDPYNDNPGSTYALIASVVPLPQDDDPNWHHPPAGPNAAQCKAVWDKGVPCPVDGKFYGYWGELQPEYCDNDHFMRDGKTLKPEAEKCTCNIAQMHDQKDCPMNSKGEPVKQMVQGATCMVYCRENTHCHCVDICDMAGEMGPKKPTSKRKLGA